jgi:hypothetical protein
MPESNGCLLCERFDEHVLFLGPLLASSSLPFAWSVTIISKSHYFSSNIVIYIFLIVLLWCNCKDTLHPLGFCCDVSKFQSPLISLELL